MIKARKLADDTVEVEYPGNIKEIFEGPEEDLEHLELPNAIGIELVALILHANQQGVSKRLLIHDYDVSAILMDQTTGTISGYDILRTNNPKYPYQRLENILANKYEP